MTGCIPIRSSLILAGFDLLDLSGSPVILNQGWDRGDAVPTVSDIQSTVLDGAAVIGEASGNRAPSIPITVRAADRVTLATLVNQVLVEVNQASWQLTFTPAGGFPVVYDCFRATVVIASTLGQEDRSVSQSLVITCEALPFARSPEPITLPLEGTPLTLDEFDSGPAPTVTAVHGAVSSTTYVTTPTPESGTHCLDIHFTPATISSTEQEFEVTVSRTGLSIPAANKYVAAELALQRSTAPVFVVWTVTITITTTTGVYTCTQFVDVSSTFWEPGLYILDKPVPAGATITGWSITITVTMQTGQLGGGFFTDLYLDDLGLVTPVSVIGDAFDPQGVVTRLDGVAGTARTPVALQLVSHNPANQFSQFCVHSVPADTPDTQPLLPLGGVVQPAHCTTKATVRYAGTYSVWLAVGTTFGAGNHTWTLTFTQSNPSGAHARTVAISATYASPGADTMYYIGQVVLPVTDYPDESSTKTTVTVTSASTGDFFNDVLLLDTRGQTVIVTEDVDQMHNYAWIDTPDPIHALGGVWASDEPDRSDAYSIADRLQAAATILAAPGSTKFLLFSPDGLLDAVATYYPRWLQEATQ